MTNDSHKLATSNADDEVEQTEDGLAVSEAVYWEQYYEFSDIMNGIMAFWKKNRVLTI